MTEIRTWVKHIIQIGAFLVIPVLLFYLMESYEHDALEEVYGVAQILNVVLFELIALVLFFLTGSTRIALSIEIPVTMIFGLVNHYVMEFRSTPFVPWDIFSIKTAASVVDNYDMTPTEDMIKVTLAFVILFVIAQFISYRLPMKLRFRLIPLLCVSLLLGGYVKLLQNEDYQSECGLYPFLFTPAHMTKVNGMAVTFAMNMAFVIVEKPSGYNIEELEDIIEEYESAGTGDDTGDLPNIIVIMNEAFSDLAVLGNFTTSEDYMPYVHSLQQGNENTITGTLKVSVCGGNTANSEYEFLTGHTMDFLPMGSIPYQQYVKGEIPSMAWQLQELGYETHGMHPYGATGWNRDKVYPWMGFENSYFINDFTNRKYIRSYVSDRTAFNKIITTYETKEEGKPMFLFEVTMQNHGSYSDLHTNFTPDITVEGVKNNAIRQYLSLLKVTDAELKRLIEYFAQVEEDTMILFFGDHQPNDYVANQILRLNGKHTGSLTEEEVLDRYKVPYVIWANFDIEEDTGRDVDISFLGANLLQLAGIETTGYQNFLLELQAVLAADDGTAEYAKKVDEYRKLYQKLQYYYMFDYEKE